MPAETALVLRLRAMAHQETEQGLAFGRIELLESNRESFVHVEGRSAGDRMCPHRGVLGRRILPVPQVAPAVAAHVVLPAVMDGGEVAHEPLHAIRQPLVGGVHTGEQGVSA